LLIGNLNSFDYSSKNQAYLSNLIKRLNTNLVVTSDPLSGSITRSLRVMKSSLLGDTTLNSSFIKDLGFNIDQFMISCSYSGQTCNSNSFTYFYDFQLGNCYTFNKANVTNSVRKTNKIGISNSLQLELFAAYTSNFSL
jgi:hypothetical protein